jgi:alpha-1,6-mannosyltransferase
MLTICDINNFFSYTGGGVRTYHLHKLAYFEDRESVDYTLFVPSDHEEVERQGNARLIHVPAVPVPGAANYRYILDAWVLRRHLQRIDPDLIEIGSPYVAPWIVRAAAAGSKALLTGFWHADYPRAYVERSLGSLHPELGHLGFDLAWWYARQTYGNYDATFAAADCIVQSLWEHGIPRVFQTPLGVDLERFTPSKRDPELRASLGLDDARPLLFFPHRLIEEKGLSNLIAAYPKIHEATRPTLAFAGVGPGKAKLDAFMADGRYDVHYLGFLEDPEEMARWYASADVVFALSAFETFGLSAAEAMASGCALVAADAGAVREFVERAECGKLVAYGDSDALARATIELVQTGDYRRAGAAAHDFATRNFSWTATFDRMLAAYEEIVAKGGKAGLTPEPRSWEAR